MNSFHLLKGVRQGRTKQPDNQDSGSGTKRGKAMNAAKVTLTSTVVAAALGLALGLSAVPALAGPPDLQGCHPDHKDEECPVNGGGEDPIVYTAELTAGAFVFHPSVHDPNEEPSAHVVVVTPNQRENVLRSEEDLNLDIDDSPEPDTWVDMFAICNELWEPGPVVAFFVGEDDWSIDKAGGVRVVFRHIEDQGAEFRFQLIGNEFEFTADDKSFPPAPGDTSVFVLDQFAITAKSLAGGSGGTKFCRTLGGDPLFLSDLLFGLGVPSTLEITASAP